MSRQLRRGGGIMNVKPRQKYGIGSIVRSITKPLSKIADKIIPNEIPELVNKVPAPIRAALLFTPAAPYVAAANAATALSRSQGRGLSLGDVANLGINYAAYGSSGGFGGQGRYQVPGFSTDGTFTGFGKPAVVPRQEGFNSTDLLEGADYSTPDSQIDFSDYLEGSNYSTPGPQTDFSDYLEGSNYSTSKPGGEQITAENIDTLIKNASGGSSEAGAQVVKTATKDVGNIDRLKNLFNDAGGGLSGSKEVFKDVAKDVLGFKEFATFGETMKMKDAVAIFTKNPTLFIGVPTAMAYLTAPKQPDETEFDFDERKEIVNSYLKRYYSQANPTKTAAEVSSFVSDNTREYSAKGGLMGLRKNYGFGNLVKGSGVVSAKMDAGDAPVSGSGKGIGGMLSSFIANNPELFSKVSDQMNASVKTNNINFMDVNPKDGIDDRDPRNGMRQQAMGGGMMMPMQQSMPMGTPRINEGGVTELDYRAKGGFVPVGIKEKADDVPAMLSKNEFVMTADAVRAAGGGSIQKGAQKMYDTMKQLESRVV